MRCRFLFTVTALWLPLRLFAAQCPVDPLARYTRLGGDPDDPRLHVQSNVSQGTFDRSDFSGSVAIRWADKHLFAPEVTYLRGENLFEATQGVTLGMTDSALRGERASYRIADNVVDFTEVDYYLVGKTGGANGRADRLTFDRESGIDTFENVSYTTCARDSPFWQIKARAMTLDHNENHGTARDMTLRIGDTPVFWLPYFRFPLNDERASGFLTPTVASSSSRGAEFVLPYYWNIAPNQDATITSHPMSRRGFLFEGEYRYLGESQRGRIDAAWLPSDSGHDGDSRWRVGFEHTYRFNPHWHTRIDYQTVSDIDYLDDMSGGLGLYEAWYLDRYAALYGRNGWGDVMFKVQDYERVSAHVKEEARPYSRLPQFTYHKTWRADGFTFALDSEAVRFTKENFGGAWRYHTNSALAYRKSAAFGFIEPKISLDLTHYDFQAENTTFRSGHEDRVLPTLSLDSGVVFERAIGLGGERYIQTLEPRLFYLYTPYRDQSDIPLFDTSSKSKSWNWLFSRNRFTGKDRIGDTKQLTTALTSRFYRASDGQEKGRLSFGQIQYFRKRKVGLDGKVSDATSHSVLVSEGAYRIDRHWQLYGLSFWDSKKRRNNRDIVDLRYHLDADRYVGIGHRYNQEDYDQVSIGGGWRIDSDWRIFARYDYSLRHHRDFNTVFGVEYSDCCWAWRLVGRRYRHHPDAEKASNDVYLEFIFKGLGNIGSSTRKVLSDALPSFHPLPQEKTF